MRRLVLAAALTACGTDAPPPPDELETEPDPLDVESTAAPGSLDDLHERIIAKRCSGQPGLCHNGQFEPNLSTPALTYAYVVNRPGIEIGDRLRVKPGVPDASLFIDKIRHRGGVATQMPLGAEPLDEADIQALEQWIRDGAKRSPDAEPPPSLNNPPRRPEIAIFNTAGTRLDGTGAVTATRGTTLVLRHSVNDFETADAAIPFAALILQLEDGMQVVLSPQSPDNPALAPTTFDANAPLGRGDLLNYRFSWTIPAGDLPIVNPNTGARGQRTQREVVTALVLYVDGASPGIVALDTSTTTIVIP